MYFADRNPRGMFAILEPLHDLIEKGAETMKEQSFMQHFGRDLTEAKECCNRYQQQGNARELSQAWDLYYQVDKFSIRNVWKISISCLIILLVFFHVINSTGVHFVRHLVFLPKVSTLYFLCLKHCSNPVVISLI